MPAGQTGWFGICLASSWQIPVLRCVPICGAYAMWGGHGGWVRCLGALWLAPCTPPDCGGGPGEDLVQLRTCSGWPAGGPILVVGVAGGCWKLYKDEQHWPMMHSGAGGAPKWGGAGVPASSLEAALGA